jgi:hypothetical protein
MAEKTYYHDSRVYITNERVEIDDATFPMDDVTSARLVTRSPGILWPCVVLGIGIAGIITGAILVSNEDGPMCLVASTVPALLGCIGLFSAKPTHYVVTGSRSDEIPEMQFDDPAYGRRIVHAMNEAIIARESAGEAPE